MLLKVLKMSNMQQFLVRVCKEPAVYWGNPKSNGRGGFTYDPPVEVKCFWNERIQILSVNEGDKIISRAFVYVLQDMTAEGLLCRTSLSALTTLQKSKPNEIDDICIIKRFESYPGIGTSDRVRIAFLTPWLT